MQKNLYVNVYSSFICKTGNQMSFKKWKVKQIMVSLRHGVLLGNKKEWTVDTLNKADE